MKKYIALFCTLLLLFGNFGNVFANENIIGAIAPTEDFYVQQVIQLDGKVYVLNSSKLYQYSIEENKIELVLDMSEQNIDRVLAHQGQFIGIDYFGKMYTIDIAQKQIKETKNQYKIENEQFLQNAFSINGELVLAVQGNDETLQVIWTADNSTVKIQGQYFNDLIPWGDKILGVSYEGFYSIDKSKAEKIEGITEQTFDMSNVFYDPQTDAVYYTKGNFVFRFDKDWKSHKVGYIAFANEFGKHCFADGVLVYTAGNGEELSINKLVLNDMQLPDNVLNVYGMDSNLANAYNRKNPDLPIAALPANFAGDLYGDAAALAQHFKSENAADVYFINFKGVSKVLAELGYAEPLDSSAKIKEHFARFYPFVQEAMQQNGKIYYLPSEIRTENMTFNADAEALDELGVDVKNIQTYQQFMHTLQELEIKIEDGEKTLFDSEGVLVREALTGQVLSDIFAYQLKNGQAIKFNTPQTAEMLQDINQVRFETIPNSIEEFEPENGMAVDGNGLFSMEYSYTRRAWGNPKISYKLSLRPFAEQEPIQVFNTKYLAVNALSPNKEKGIAFAERLLDIFSEEHKTMLYTDINDPVLNKDTVKNIQSIEKLIAERKKELDTLEDKNFEKIIKEDIANMEKDLERTKHFSYSITKEMIEDYNANQDKLYILDANLIDFKNEQLMQLLQRYIKGQVEILPFLQEFDHIISMAHLESK